MRSRSWRSNCFRTGGPSGVSLAGPIESNECLCTAWVSAAYVALFPNWVTVHSGIGGGRSKGWAGLWLVQRGISAVGFWIRVGLRWCDLSLGSEGPGPLEFLPGCRQGVSETKGHSYEKDPGWGGCCLSVNLRPACPPPVSWGPWRCQMQGSSFPPGQAFPRDD